MLAPNKLQQIDQLLNELEGLARSEISSQKFYHLLLERLQHTLGARCAELLLPLGTHIDESVLLGSVGTPEPSIRGALLRSIPTSEERPYLAGQLDQTLWLAVALRPGQYHLGCLLVVFSTTTTGQQTTALVELLNAFAEVAALKQLAEVERLFSQRWRVMEEVCRQLPATTQLPQARSLLVNQLVRLFGATRVGLVSRSFIDGWVVRAVSGTTTIDRSLAPVQHLEHEAAEAARLAKRISRTQVDQEQSEPITIPQSNSPLDSHGLFHNRLVVPLESTSTLNTKWQDILIIEWATRDAMLLAVPAVSLALPVLSASWQQQVQWLRLPRWLRTLGRRSFQLPLLIRRAFAWCLVPALAIAVYVTLTRPQSLMIEAPAVLEPQIKRSLFAPADGYVDRLHVVDGQQVKSGQAIARLRSPALELQIEELQGNLRAVLEKRSALRVAINQIDPAARDALLSQSRLSAEVAELDVREKNLKQQLEFLHAEQRQLEIVAPIDGLVATRELEQQLTGRPLRRGDALLTILDLNGPWQLRMRVADRDSGYVRRKLASDSSDAHSIAFVLESLPEQRFSGQVDWVSDLVQNDQGCFVEVHAHVARDVVEQSRMGAGARVWFDCGQQPMWFVWCRPLVEAAQRKLWLERQQGSQDVNGR